MGSTPMQGGMVIAASRVRVLQLLKDFIGLVHWVIFQPKVGVWRVEFCRFAETDAKIKLAHQYRQLEIARRTSACQPNEIGRHYTDGSESEVRDTAGR